MAKIDLRNPPNEMPDIVGYKPENPILASFRSFIPPRARLRELTPLPLIIGTLLGMVFGASSLYLVLKVGLTVSASIPVAVISITIFRLGSKIGFRDANVLQNNIVQTAGSAGESIAFGLGVTMPAIMILGFDMEIARVMLVAILGGLLGILMMIPLRRALIVEQHGILKYPEGTACAEVLKAGATREEHEMGLEASQAQTEAEVAHGAKTIVFGFGLGLVYKLAEGAFKLWKDPPETVFGAPLAKAAVAAEISPAVPRTDRDISLKWVALGIVVLIGAILVAHSLNMNLAGALLIVLFGFLFVTVSSRLTGELGSSSNPISGMTVATLLLTCLIFLVLGWTEKSYYVTALSVGAIVCIASSNGGSTSQDLKTGFLVGGTPKYQQIAILLGAFASALVLGPILMTLNDAKTVYVPASKVAPGLKASSSELGKVESIRGIQAREDSKSYRVWHKTDTEGGPAGKYLVDDAGNAVWLVDPGINGNYRERPDGTKVESFTAPKATLMSYIIKGILDRKLPWALVLLGAMIAITLEMSGIPALAFAVGVYLPLSSSAPIFVGGLIRWLVDRKQRASLKSSNLSEEQLIAESDKSPGVLLSSGYIAGGAIAGIVIAFLAGFLEPVDKLFNLWAENHNPFFAGPNADLLSLLPFLVLCLILYRVGLAGVK